MVGGAWEGHLVQMVGGAWEGWGGWWVEPGRGSCPNPTQCAVGAWSGNAIQVYGVEDPFFPNVSILAVGSV